MRFQGLNIPDSLVNAAQDGQLVILAGAGVSMQEDVRMPSFKALVDRIEDEAGESRSGGDLDKRLGNLHRKGVRVHEICSKVFNEYGNVFSALHKHLLRIFPLNETRIVTTNFDNCFERAIDDIELEIPKYCAPALPLGDNFWGLVHIHGSIDDPNHQVLTDADYGRAYVSKGWASRFLSEMFSSYVVLLVGYSCDDLLVDYLTRSLSADKKSKVFALTKDVDDPASWEARGIEVIEYDRHDQLPDLFQDWGELIEKDLNQHRKKIIELIDDPLPPKGFDEDYVRGAFSTIEGKIRDIKLETFMKYAKKEDILYWAAEKNLLEPLFADIEGKVGDLTVSWVADTYAVNSYEAILKVRAKVGKGFSSSFLKRVLRCISLDANCPAKAAGIWLPLIASADSGVECSAVEILRLFDVYKNNLGLVRMLVSMLLSIKIVNDGGYYGDTLKLKPALVVNRLYQKEVITEAILNGIDQGDLGLLSELFIALERANLYQQHCFTQDGRYGTMSFSRSAIEPHDQDRYANDGIYWVLDALREAGLHLKEDKKTVFEGLMYQCLSSRAGLLRRLGLYYLGESSISSDEKCLYVKSNNLLDDFDLHHELFGLLKNAFPCAGTTTKDELLIYIKSYYKNEGSESSDYSLFSLCRWLFDADAEYRPLQDVIDEVLSRNPEYEQREHPDFHTWMYDSIGVADSDNEGFSGASYKKIIATLQKPATENNPFRLEYNVQNSIRKIAKENRTWALSILAEAKNYHCDSTNEMLVTALVEGISWDEYFEDSTDSAKGTLVDIPLSARTITSIAREIEEVAKYADEAKWSSEKYEAIFDLVKFFWPSMLSLGESNVPDYEESGWLMYSINHPISNLCEALFSFLSYEAREAKGKYEISDSTDRLISAGINYTGDVASAVKTSLFRQLAFFHSIAPDWTRKKLLPLLDIKSEKVDACWEGLSYSSRMTASLWEDIERPLVALLQSDICLHSDAENNLAQLCAFLCFTFIENPLKSGFMLRCLGHFASSKKESFIMHLGYAFETQQESVIQKTWNEWLSSLNGVVFDVYNQGYVDYHAVYQKYLFHWVSTVPSLSRKIAYSILQIHTAEAFDGSSALLSLKNSALDESDQDLLVDLLVYVLRRSTLDAYDEISVVDLVERFDKERIAKASLNNLRTALTAAHYLDAVEKLD